MTCFPSPAKRGEGGERAAASRVRGFYEIVRVPPHSTRLPAVPNRATGKVRDIYIPDLHVETLTVKARDSR
jgi:hypothetical protein